MEHAIKKLDGVRVLCTCLWEAGVPVDIRGRSLALRMDHLLDYYNQHRRLKEQGGLK